MSENMKFKESTVVVTGGAGVLGKAVVDWFSERGASVAVLDISDEVLATTYPNPDENHCYIACDLTSREGSSQAIGKVLRQFSEINILCNIAGGFLMGDPVHETSDSTWEFLFDLNARSILNMASAVVPGMLVSGGKIVNVSARAGDAGAANMGAYTASKAAVTRLTESMALELREKNINVNCVMPSLIDTPRNRSDMPDADFGSWVKPGQIAELIGFLASAESLAIHGAAIPISGLV
jgi:NAD(P)-dependent dehydrogenase (short-subunit alcohol dehydrogenase family)